SGAAAVAWLAASVREGRPGWAATGLIALALLEGSMFGAPWNPQLPPSKVPPPSRVMSWLQRHGGGGYLAGTKTVMIAETAALYGLTDVRGYEIGGLTPRFHRFWQRADPSYGDRSFF